MTDWGERLGLTKAPTRLIGMGVKLKGDEVCTSSGNGPLAGATARIETTGTVNRRNTITRRALTGPLASSLPKKQDDRDRRLVVEGHGFRHEVGVPKNQAALVEKFVANFNAQAAKLAPSAPRPDAVASTADELRKLAELRSSGVLTDEEFAAAKARLLS